MSPRRRLPAVSSAWCATATVLRSTFPTATDQPIRDYVTEHTGFSGENIENDRTTTESPVGLEDVDLNAINNPWSAGFGDTILLIERPLGRGWLIIIGGGR